MRKPHTADRRSGAASACVPGVWRLRLPLPLAGRAALQRLGARGRRRDRARRLRHAHAAARWPTSSARSSRSACGWSTCGCSSAPTPTSTTAARRRRSRRARAASCGSTRATSTYALARRPATRRSPRRIEVARQSGVPEAPLRAWAEAPRRRRARACRGPLAPDRDLVPGVEVRDRPRRVGGARDARPRAVARRAAPARAAAAALGRPRARPHLALLRPRLDARPGRASSSRSLDLVDGLDVRLIALRPRAAVHRPPRARRGQPRAGRRAARRGRARRSQPRGEATAFELLPGGLRRAADARATAAGCSPRRSATSSTSRLREGRAGGEPERWAPTRWSRRLDLAADADRRADRRGRRSPRSPSSSSRPGPTRGSATSAARWPSSRG